MYVIEVSYPFEVDEEHGDTNMLYESLSAARRDARKRFSAFFEAESAARATYGNNDAKPDLRPATVDRLRVTHLNRRAFVVIINSRGGQWVAEREHLGRLHWSPRGLRYEPQVSSRLRWCLP
jgi:hypothetical protein